MASPGATHRTALHANYAHIALLAALLLVLIGAVVVLRLRFRDRY